MSEGEALQPLRIDADLWTHRDMLERIVGRWFEIREELAGVDIGWSVGPHPDRMAPSEALRGLNDHLRELTWLAVLQEGDPFELVILPEHKPFGGLRGAQLAGVWAVMLAFLTLTGGAWLQLQHPDLTLLDGGLLQEALLWFAVPVGLTLAVTSELRRRLGLAHGVDLGHHLPLSIPFPLFPAAPIWPFGLLGMVSLRRMDLMPFRDRASLAAISMFTPVSLLLSGTAFTIAGFWLTPLDAPVLQSAPTHLRPGWLAEWVLEGWIGAESVGLAGGWLHPLGLAGITLSTVGWVLLLPMPGFPGDRLLTALLGTDHMHAQQTQTWLYLGLLIAGTLVLLNGAFWPWVLLIALGAWRRFYPEANPPPFVLDEVKGLRPEARKQLAAMLLIAIVLGFPGLQPVSQVNDWDAGLEIEDWPDQLFTSGLEEKVVELPLNPVGVMPVDVQIRLESIAGERSDWEIELVCGEDTLLLSNEAKACTMQDVRARDEVTLELRASRQSDANVPATSPMALRILLFESGRNEPLVHTMEVLPDTGLSPLSAAYEWNGDLLNPRICMEFRGHPELGANLTEIWQGIDNGSSIPAGETREVCASGDALDFGRTHPSGDTTDRTRSTGIQGAILDDGTLIEWWHLHVGGTVEYMAAGAYPAASLRGDVSDWGGNLLLWSATDPHPHCPSVLTGFTPAADAAWSLNLEEVPLVLLPEDLANGTLVLPDHGRFVVCNPPFSSGASSPPLRFEMVPAPAPLRTGLLHESGWTFAAHDVHNPGEAGQELGIELHGNIPADWFWDLDQSFTVPANGSLTLEMPILNLTEAQAAGLSGERMLTVDANGWTLHLSTTCWLAEGCSDPRVGGES